MKKTLKDIDPQLRTVLDEFQAVAIVKQEMALDAYNLQDKQTKAAIDRITATLQQHATGYINVSVGGTLHPVKIDNEYLGYSLFWLAVEIVKDLAFVNLRMANFIFPPSLCISCGAEVIPEKRKGRKK